jgi:hypothetical protein
MDAGYTAEDLARAAFRHLIYEAPASAWWGGWATQNRFQKGQAGALGL